MKYVSINHPAVYCIRMANIHPRPISNVSSYVRFIDKLKEGKKCDLLFRGQPADGELLPRVGRERPKGKLKRTEGLVFKEFKRNCHHLVGNVRIDSDWDWLALAQHYGLPTRLLDWSYNALVALWFATGAKSKDAAVWMLYAETRYLLSDDRLKEGNPFNNSATRILRSKIVSTRISAQAAVFTAHQIREENGAAKMVPLEKNKRYSENLTMVTIKKERFAKIREELNWLGINEALIFPDISGLCGHMKARYFHASKN